MRDKWSYLVESDKQLRELERAYKESGAPEDLAAYISVKLRSDPKSLFNCSSPPRTATAWKRIASTFGAKLHRPVSSGSRYIELVFPSNDLRQMFFTASSCVRPQLSMEAMTGSDGPGHYHLEVQLGRAVRAPRLVRVNFQQSQADSDHPQVQGVGYYHNPQMIEFRSSGKQYEVVVGVGSNDDTSLWRLQGVRDQVMLLAINDGMPYVGLTTYSLPSDPEEFPEEVNNWFLDGHRVAEVLGPRETNLSAQQIVRRVLIGY